MATPVEPPNGVHVQGKHYFSMWQTLFEIDTKYVPIKPIGRGAYGIVCSSINRDTNERVAIKKIHNAFENRVDALRTLREIKLLRHLRDENVISLKDVMVPTHRKNFMDVYLVYELMDTDLHQIIKSSQALSNDHCQYFLFQLLRGLKYLHSANILHRDLKPGNLLINANCELKICDFGLARTSNGNGQFMTEYVVTRWYRAPELLLCCDNYGTSIDVWSVGCIFAELLGRKPLFPGTECLSQLKLIINILGSQREEDIKFIDNPKARKFIKSLPYSPGTPFSRLYPNAHPMAIDLLQKMLIFDPTKRIGVMEALQHPYMAPLYDPASNPPAQVPIDLDIDEDLAEDTIRDMMWEEILHYHPEAATVHLLPQLLFPPPRPLFNPISSDSTDPSSDCVSVRMCSSKPKLHQQHRVALAHINGRPVLHHTCNQINSCPDHSRNPPHPPPPLPSKSSLTRVSTSPPISPKIRSLRSPPNGLSSSSVDKVTKTKDSSPSSGVTMRKSMSRALSFQETRSIDAAAIGAGSIAAARKEQVAMQQEQRKMKIAHYGRVKSAKFESRVVPLNPSPPATTTAVAASTNRDEKRCTFVTSNSDPVFVAYHDEEWGVPVHDDRLLFELLVLTGAQVGSDWSSVLKKRQIFREAFAGFDADAVAKFTEKKITSLSAAYGIDQSLIRAAVDNSRRILEIAKEFGTFSEYLWGFVNKKPIVTQYKRCQKIPVKTSKSETISKDMVKRGFRSVGPTVIYSFMQAAGLTNDHLITCPRHLQCSSLSAAPAPAY